MDVLYCEVGVLYLEVGVLYCEVGVLYSRGVGYMCYVCYIASCCGSTHGLSLSVELKLPHLELTTHQV